MTGSEPGPRPGRLPAAAILLGVAACFLAGSAMERGPERDPARARVAVGPRGAAVLLVTVLSLVPALAVMVTCFPFIVTVLSILRQAIGLQQAPPNMLIVSLALFLTYFVMDPVFQAAWTEGVKPLIDGQIEVEAAFAAT